MPARSLSDCLNAPGTSGTGLDKLSHHAGRLLRMQRILESALPRTLVRGARVANYKLGKLIIHADSGAVAAKLKQITPTLLGVFLDEGTQVTGIEVRVQPRTTQPQRSSKKTSVPLGNKPKQGLTSLAADLPADSPLRQALEHLLRSA